MKLSNQNRQIGKLFNKKPDTRTFAPDPRLPISDKYVGIEIEAEGIPVINEDLDNLLSYWTVVADGSLRNYGTEFVSAMLRGADIYAALEELNSVLAANQISPEFSERTSVHIHVDSRFLTPEHLRVLVLHYLMLEPFLFKYIGNDRENNPYCVPYYKNNRGIRNLSYLFRPNFVLEDVVNAVRDGAKYEAMNIRSIQEKGSIEFRLHNGTCNSNEIFNWIMVLLTLFRLSKETSEAQFFDSFYNVKYSDYIQEVRQFFPRDLSPELALCEHIGSASVTKLLSFASRTRSAIKEVGMHWSKTLAATAARAPIITDDIT